MKKMLLATLLLVATVGASAQKFKPAPVFLKGEKQLNLVFDYSQVKFDGDSREKQYKDKGAKWVEEWESKRIYNNAESFIKSINEELVKIDLKAEEDIDAPYTMIVDVLDCDFGAFAGPFSQPAKVKALFKIVKTGTTEVLASVTVKEEQNKFTLPGTPVDFDRMYLAFAELGEEIGEKLVKILK